MSGDSPNNERKAVVPLNINRGLQQYCMINAVGNALDVYIDRGLVDCYIQQLSERTGRKQGEIKIGMLTIHGLDHCVHKFFPGMQLRLILTNVAHESILKYLRENRLDTGIIYAYTSYPNDKNNDAPWKDICHMIAFRDGYLINDYNYCDLKRNVSNVSEDDCLLRHFERTKPGYPYMFRFYRLLRVSTKKRSRNI